tara:strand:- start:438 stop:2381 length:1944 start_codon:yes stop_codon:yes gene_type:complete
MTTPRGFKLDFDAQDAIKEIKILEKTYIKALNAMHQAGLKGRYAEKRARSAVQDRIREEGGIGTGYKLDKRGQPYDPKTGHKVKVGGGQTLIGQGAVDAELTAAQKRVREGQLADPNLSAKKQVNANNIIRNSVSDLTKETKLLTQTHKELGVNSGINVQKIRQLRLSFEKYRSQIHGTDKASRMLKTTIDQQIASLARLNTVVAASSTRMTFMAGASLAMQSSIRNLGAAAQGGMIAMSALNGDVLGLAFSLIFLQFTANHVVTLGFAAMAIAAGFAWKGIKKVREENEKTRRLSDTWQEITGSLHAQVAAEERAESIAASLNLREEEQEKLVKSLTQTQMQLLDRGLNPTNEALMASAALWLMSINRTGDYTKAIEDAAQGTISFVEDGEASFGNLGLSLDQLIERAETLLGMRYMKGTEGVPLFVQDIIDGYRAAGEEIPKVLEGLGGKTIDELFGIPEMENAAALFPEFGRMLAEGLMNAELERLAEVSERLHASTGPRRFYQDFKTEFKDATKTLLEGTPTWTEHLNTLINKFQDLAYEQKVAFDPESAARGMRLRPYKGGEEWDPFGVENKNVGIANTRYNNTRYGDTRSPLAPVYTPNGAGSKNDLTINIEFHDNVVNSDSELASLTLDAVTTGITDVFA